MWDNSEWYTHVYGWVDPQQLSLTGTAHYEKDNYMYMYMYNAEMVQYCTIYVTVLKLPCHSSNANARKCRLYVIHLYMHSV